MSGLEQPAQPRTAGPGRIQLRLADLLAWIPAVAVVATLWRRATPSKWFGSSFDANRIFGLSAAMLAIFLGVGLLRQVVMLYRRRRAGDEPRGRGPIAWRIAMVVLLLAFVIEQAGLLGDMPTSLEDPESWIMGYVLPVTSTVALAGVMTGLSLGRPQAPRRRMAWLSVVWAGTAGVVITATQVLIPFLVLIAIEAVKIALFHPDPAQRAQPSLRARLIHAGLEAIPAMLACVVLGVQLSRELRRPCPEADESVSIRWRSFLILAAMTVTAALFSGALVWKTFPMLSERMAEGFQMLLGPRVVSAIVVGFAGLALGLAARAADRPCQPLVEPMEIRPWRRYLAFLLKTFVVLFLLGTIVSQLFRSFRSHVDSWTSWLGWTDVVLQWTHWLVVPMGGSFWTLFESPELLVIGIAQLWIAWRVLLLLGMPLGPVLAPIDAAFESPPALTRLVSRWVALTVLMIAAMPVLFLQGLALFTYWLHAIAP